MAATPPTAGSPSSTTGEPADDPSSPASIPIAELVLDEKGFTTLFKWELSLGVMPYGGPGEEFWIRFKTDGEMSADIESGWSTEHLVQLEQILRSAADGTLDREEIDADSGAGLVVEALTPAKGYELTDEGRLHGWTFEFTPTADDPRHLIRVLVQVDDASDFETAANTVATYLATPEAIASGGG